MSARDRLPFGSGDEAARDAAAPVLNALRSELLVLPRDEVIENHVNMMAFEQQLLATPRFAKTRATLPRPRRVGFVILAVVATLASCGLSAAGALPAPLQHITDTIARTLGVPEPHDTGPAPRSGAIGPQPTVTRPAVVVPGAATPPTHHVSARSSSAAPKAKPEVSAKPSSHVTKPSSDLKVQSVPPKIAQARPTPGSHRITKLKQGPPPSNTSTNTPAGYPNDWRTLAGAAATAQLHTCAQADTLNPTDCPQVASAAGNAQVQTVHWMLVNNPEPAPVVVARKSGAATTTYVYERFQMGASYTKVGGTRTYLAYSGGIAAATMTWNGSSFTNVTFASGSAVGHLLPGVTVPSFLRPPGVSDSAVLTVVQADFSLPGGQGTVTGDPTRGAVVTFDAQQGEYTVTGTYTKTSTNGASTTGQYTATLFFDGENLQILSIVGS